MNDRWQAPVVCFDRSGVVRLRYDGSSTAAPKVVSGSRVADVQVRGAAAVSRDFDRVFVDYREKKTGYIKYNVEIDDKTRQATTVVNDYR